MNKSAIYSDEFARRAGGRIGAPPQVRARPRRGAGPPRPPRGRDGGRERPWGAWPAHKGLGSDPMGPRPSPRLGPRARADSETPRGSRFDVGESRRGPQAAPPQRGEGGGEPSGRARHTGSRRAPSQRHRVPGKPAGAGGQRDALTKERRPLGTHSLRRPEGARSGPAHVPYARRRRPLRQAHMSPTPGAHVPYARRTRPLRHHVPYAIEQEGRRGRGPGDGDPPAPRKLRHEMDHNLRLIICKLLPSSVCRDCTLARGPCAPLNVAYDSA